MKRTNPYRSIILFAMVCAACGGGIRQQSIRTSSRMLPPKPPTATIDIYRAAQTPNFPFEEVGVVSATKQAGSAFGSASVTELIPVLQDQARSLGADAIIIQDAAEFMAAALTGARTIPAASLSGVAIAYVRPSRPTLTLAPDTRARPTEALSTQALVAVAAPSVVQIETDISQGSGVIISPDGLVITNEHVIAGATAIIVVTQEGRRAVAAVQATDSLADVALLKVSLGALPAARLGAVSTVAPGADVVVIGSPLGLTQTVSRGVVSSVRNFQGRRLIQTDAAVSPGNSGGPLLNDRAEVIGIVSFKLSDPLAEGLNFAVAVDDALAVVGISN